METCADGLVFDNSGPLLPYNIEFGSQTDFEHRSLRRIVQGWELLQHFTHKLCAFFFCMLVLYCGISIDVFQGWKYDI